MNIVPTQQEERDEMEGYFHSSYNMPYRRLVLHSHGDHATSALQLPGAGVPVQQDDPTLLNQWVLDAALAEKLQAPLIEDEAAVHQWLAAPELQNDGSEGMFQQQQQNLIANHPMENHAIASHYYENPEASSQIIPIFDNSGFPMQYHCADQDTFWNSGYQQLRHYVSNDSIDVTDAFRNETQASSAMLLSEPFFTASPHLSPGEIPSLINADYSDGISGLGNSGLNYSTRGDSVFPTVGPTTPATELGSAFDNVTDPSATAKKHFRDTGANHHREFLPSVEIPGTSVLASPAIVPSSMNDGPGLQHHRHRSTSSISTVSSFGESELDFSLLSLGTPTMETTGLDDDLDWMADLAAETMNLNTDALDPLSGDSGASNIASDKVTDMVTTMTSPAPVATTPFTSPIAAPIDVACTMNPNLSSDSSSCLTPPPTASPTDTIPCCSDTQTVYLFVDEYSSHTENTSESSDSPTHNNQVQKSRIRRLRPREPKTEHNSFKCKCGKLFKKLWNLRNHLKVHEEGRRFFECEIYEKA
ncbi:hypothetical protein BC832DRAFT_107181 [Gaertneriomyces semiglobifer]|nr:hypothetical protein BC832DRAFT_107181 [Gaertneriomyces semiglobifer]